MPPGAAAAHRPSANALTCLSSNGCGYMHKWTHACRYKNQPGSSSTAATRSHEALLQHPAKNRQKPFGIGLRAFEAYQNSIFVGIATQPCSAALHQIRQLPDDMQARELDRAYRVVSCAVHSEAAKQLRKAAGLK